MSSFPRIIDLPPVIETFGWHWTPFTSPYAPSDGFWLGTDREGNRWLTKLRGDFRAYREIIFGRLAQRMNWSCQSSVFMRVDAKSASLLKTKPGAIHAAHWFLDEHVYPPCTTEGCSLVPLVDKKINRVEDLEGFSITHLLDWPKSELAACLFGGHELPGHLFTSSHEFVIIDSELMFASRPSPFFNCTMWWGNELASHPSGLKVALEVCDDLLALGHVGLHQALILPSGIAIEECWPIAPILFDSFAYAEAFRAQHCGT